ncbi:MAG: ABC transporter permease subunit [Acidimicrobiales bacterium]
MKLAQAIAADPRLVLLDEPTDGLDPVQRDEMLSLIRQINDDYGIDVVLSSHLLEEVERICDHVVALDAGRLVAQGRLADLVGAVEGVVVELVALPDLPNAVVDVVTAPAAGLEVTHEPESTALEVFGESPDHVADAVRDAIADCGAGTTDRTASSPAERSLRGCAMTSTDGAEILDRGYRRFDGDRAGVAGAVRSVAWHTTRSILGLGRKARHKIFPVIIILLSFVRAIVFVGVAAIFPVDIFEGQIIPAYWELLRDSILPVLLFAAMVAPEALVRDRRDGMLSLYLSTPLTRGTYLLSKVISVFGIMTVTLVGPALLLLLGFTFEGVGPAGPVDWLVAFLRVLAAGVAVAVVFTALALACSSITDRRAFASISVVLFLIGLSAVVAVLIDPADATPTIRLLDPVTLPLEMAPRIFGAAGDHPELSTVEVFSSNLAGGRRRIAAVVPLSEGVRATAAATATDGRGGARHEGVRGSCRGGLRRDLHDRAWRDRALGPNGAEVDPLPDVVRPHPPSQGRVRVLGHDGLNRHRRAYASVSPPQQDALFDHLTARRFVEIAARIHGLRRRSPGPLMPR